MDRIIKSVSSDQNVYKPGEVLFKEGSVGDHFFIIKSGQVKILQNAGKDDEKELAVIDAGHVLGEVSAIDGGPRTATAVAQTDVVASQINGQALKYQIKQCPHWFGAIILDLVERLRRTDNLLSSQGITHANQHSSQKATALPSEDSEESGSVEEEKKSEEGSGSGA